MRTLRQTRASRSVRESASIAGNVRNEGCGGDGDPDKARRLDFANLEILEDSLTGRTARLDQEILSGRNALNSVKGIR